jgi:predicted PhzF superfamily epimerase YddE/YHI9
VNTELHVVDAFTDRPFTGNPAAVAILDQFPADQRMQQIAAEMNLAETAFAVSRRDGGHDLRWLTPQVEVDLCGHATLATACVLGGSARFHTRSGLLTCTASDDGWIDMDFPADRAVEQSPPATFDRLGVRWYGRGGTDVLVEVGDASAVRSFVPDLPALAALGSRAVIVTAPGDRAGVDCVSRVFAPNVGIPEDPVTGSAHCTLAVHWSQRLGTDQLVGVQASSRGGTVRMRVAGDRVVISGQAVIVSLVTLLA